MSDILTRMVKHLSLIYKILGMLAASALIVVMFPHTYHGTHYDYKEGAVWRDADLVAPFDFPVVKSASEVEQAREVERQKTILYYRIDGT